MEHVRTTTSPQPKPENAEALKRRSEFLTLSVHQLSVALGQEVSSERVAMYLRALIDVPDNRLAFAFEYALKHSAHWLPSPGEIRKWAEDWNPYADREAQLVRGILERSSKPPGWVPTGEVFREADRRAARLSEADRAFELTDEDRRWPKNMPGDAAYCRCPLHQVARGTLYYACYVRIREAKAGKTPTSAVALAATIGIREPGCDDE